MKVNFHQKLFIKHPLIHINTLAPNKALMVYYRLGLLVMQRSGAVIFHWYLIKISYTVYIYSSIVCN
jgi:hypothetical protein